MFNIPDTKITSKNISYADFTVESQNQFSALRTAKYGIIALLSVLILNVIVVVNSARVY